MSQSFKTRVEETARAHNISRKEAVRVVTTMMRMDAAKKARRQGRKS